MQIAFLLILSILLITGTVFIPKILNPVQLCVAVARKVVLIAFSGTVTESFCLRVSALVCFTLGTYKLRGSEENKVMKPLETGQQKKKR